MWKSWTDTDASRGCAHNLLVVGLLDTSSHDTLLGLTSTDLCSRRALSSRLHDRS